MIVGVFFSVQKQPDLNMAAYEALNDRMWAIVSGHRIRADRRDRLQKRRRPLDGHSVFENREGMLQWKQEVEHAAAQQAGRDEFFLDYWGFVAEMTDAYEYDREGGRRQVPLDSRWRPDGFEAPGA